LARPGSGIASRTIFTLSFAPWVSDLGRWSHSASPPPSSATSLAALSTSRASNTASTRGRGPSSSIRAFQMLPRETKAARFSPMPAS